MRFDFVVLGATGIQGRIVTKDLLENNYSVLMCGRNKSRVMHLLKNYNKTDFEYFDMRDIDKTSKIIKNSSSNVVVNCIEGDYNLNALKACVKANAHSLDLGSEIWMTKEQLKMNGKLKKRNLIHITGCGSVPGIGNVMLRHASKKFDRIDTIEVGFIWDSNIKKFVIPFSIQSIMEEFTDPAPILKDGRFKNLYPMDTICEKNCRVIGKQKCFHARHPETYTFYNYFKDKGVKNVRFYAGFPDHSFYAIKSMIDLGFESKKETIVGDVKIKPIYFLTEFLKDLDFPDGYKEIENLWVNIIGKRNSLKKTIKMECIAPTINGWEDAGCNIDTGMPASIMAQMIKKDIITEKGSFAPEAIVPPELFFKELRKRKMIVLENGRIIN